jgi:hypothetical protein
VVLKWHVFLRKKRKWCKRDVLSFELRDITWWHDGCSVVVASCENHDKAEK